MESMMAVPNLHLNYTYSSNITTGILESESLDQFKTIKIFFYFLILICSTFGNITVSYIICTTKKMRTPSNYLILNLAICDALTPLISIPFDFGLEENSYVWEYGGFLCKILWPASTITATSSALTLAVIALDRYRLIMHPFKPRLTSRVIKIAILSTHVLAMAIVAPYVSMLEFKDEVCGEHWPSFVYRQSYTVVLFLIQYGLPLPFMIVMYVLALNNLYKSTRRTSVMQTSYHQNDGAIFTKEKKSMNGVTKKESRKERNLNLSQIRENEANKRATLMFIVVVAVFTVFMLPNQIIWLWADFGDGLSRPGFHKAMIICWLFTYSNSVFNPVIFTAFSKDFRNGFRKIFINKCAVWKAKESKSDTDLSSYCRPTSHSVVSQATTVSTAYVVVNTADYETVL